MSETERGDTKGWVTPLLTHVLERTSVTSPFFYPEMDNPFFVLLCASHEFNEDQ